MHCLSNLIKLVSFAWLVGSWGAEQARSCAANPASGTCNLSPADSAMALMQKKKLISKTEKNKKGIRFSEDDENAIFISGIPIYNFLREHPAGPNPSLLQVRKTALRLIVEFKRGQSSDDTIHAFCKALPSECKFEGHPSENGEAFAVVEDPPEDLEEAFANNPEIAFAEVDFKMYATPEMPPEVLNVNDTDGTGPGLLQWPWSRRRGLSWGLDRIDDASGLDDSYEVSGGSGAHVYILDTGVRWSHNDFGGRAVPALDLTRDWLEPCSAASTSCAVDRHGHGTHCAGTVGGDSYGVAKDARIYGVKVMSDDGSGRSSWIHAGLDWIVTHGNTPAVASMSLSAFGAHYSFKWAVDAAVSGGVTVVVAAGNDASDACNYSPGFISSAITVGATTGSDGQASFSNYGSCVDILAPGTNIVSAGSTSDTDEDYSSGTSMACPHVSGAAALLLSENPGLSPAAVASFLVSNAGSGYISGTSGSPNKLLRV